MKTKLKAIFVVVVTVVVVVVSSLTIKLLLLHHQLHYLGALFLGKHSNEIKFTVRAIL